jgi:hypothetical protein
VRARRPYVRAVAVGIAAATAGVVAMIACGPPPEGWSGAGRLQTLPALQPDAGGGSVPDTGTTGTPDVAVDTGTTPPVDAGKPKDAAPDTSSGGQPDASGTPDASGSDASNGDGATDAPAD